MTVEATISIGNLITIFCGIVLWAITLALAWSKFDNRMTMVEFRVKLVEEALVKIALVLEKFNNNEKETLLLKNEVASLHVNYARINDTLEDLRRGNGWISSPRREAVTGEYPRPLDARG